jgi:hypothetical protein
MIFANIIPHREDQVIRPICECLALLSQVSFPIIRTAAAAKSICDSFKQLIEFPSLFGYSIVIFASLIRHSPVFVSIVRSSSELRRYRSVLTTALSGDDHLSALGSIVALLLLAPRSIDCESARVAGLHGLAVSAENVLMVKCSLWILIEVARDSGLSGEDLQTLLRTALISRGLKAYLVFEAVNSIVANGGMALVDPRLSFDQTVTYLLTKTSGFVSVSAVRFLQQVHEHRADVFAELADLDKICAKALEIAALSSLSVDLDLLESAVIVLRLIAKTAGCIDRVRGMLAENEEQIFVAFQRNIESNRSFASLCFFLFIEAAAGFIRDWKRRLRLVVIDTQFGALIAHVLQRATERGVLADAIRTLSLVSTPSGEFEASDQEVLFNSLVSGFAAINGQLKRESRGRKCCMAQQIARQEDELVELRASIEVQQLELRSHIAKADLAERRCAELEALLEQERAQAREAQADVSSLREKVHEQGETLVEVTAARDGLAVENEKQTVLLQEFKEVLVHLKECEQAMLIKGNESQQLERSHGELAEKVNSFKALAEELRAKIAEQAETIESYKRKVKGMRGVLKEEVVTSEGYQAVNERILIELEMLKKQAGDNERRFQEDREVLENAKAKAREKQKTIDRLHELETELRKELLSAEQRNAELEKRLEEVETEQKRWELIVQFLHRITDGSPLPADELLSLFDDPE